MANPSPRSQLEQAAHEIISKPAQTADSGVLASLTRRVENTLANLRRSREVADSSRRSLKWQEWYAREEERARKQLIPWYNQDTLPHRARTHAQLSRIALERRRVEERQEQHEQALIRELFEAVEEHQVLNQLNDHTDAKEVYQP